MHMITASSVTQERKRSASILLKPAGLLFPLNHDPASACVQRGIALLYSLQKLEEAESTPEGGQTRHYRAANKLLRKYLWHPVVSSDPAKPNSFSAPAKTAEEEWENCFATWLLTLRSKRELLLVRKCRNCVHWFFAITTHQSYCTNSCRQQFHSKDEEFKLKRRWYMKKYRDEEKLRHASERKALKV